LGGFAHLGFFQYDLTSLANTPLPFSCAAFESPWRAPGVCPVLFWTCLFVNWEVGLDVVVFLRTLFPLSNIYLCVDFVVGGSQEQTLFSFICVTSSLTRNLFCGFFSTFARPDTSGVGFVFLCWFFLWSPTPFRHPFLPTFLRIPLLRPFFLKHFLPPSDLADCWRGVPANSFYRFCFVFLSMGSISFAPV